MATPGLVRFTTQPQQAEHKQTGFLSPTSIAMRERMYKQFNGIIENNNSELTLEMRKSLRA